MLNLAYGFPGAPANNGNVASQTIHYDAVGSETAATITQSYSYTDGMNRLTGFVEGSISQSYSHDQYGNHWVSANAGYTLSSLTPTASSWFKKTTNRINGVTYDARGNQTGFSPTPRSAAYNGDDLQASIAVSGTPGSAASYEYDGDGHRVRKLTCSGTAPCTGSSSGLATTVYLYDAFGELAAEYASQAPASSGTEYYTADHLGSTRLVLGADGSVKERYDYLPFGEQLGSGVNGRSGKYSASLLDGESVKFTGKERDGESALDLFQTRFFSAAQGRFTSVDSTLATVLASDPQSWNRYAYVNGEPLMYVDPNGENPVLAVAAEVAGEIAEGAATGAAASGLTSAVTQKVFNGKVDWRQVGAAAGGGAVAGALTGGAAGLEYAGTVALEAGDGAIINALANVAGGAAGEQIGKFIGVEPSGTSGGTAAVLDFVFGFGGAKIAERYVPAAVEKNLIALRRSRRAAAAAENLAAAKSRDRLVSVFGSTAAATFGETTNKLYDWLSFFTRPSWQSFLMFGLPPSAPTATSSGGTGQSGTGSVICYDLTKMGGASVCTTN